MKPSAAKQTSPVKQHSTTNGSNSKTGVPSATQEVTEDHGKHDQLMDEMSDQEVSTVPTPEIMPDIFASKPKTNTQPKASKPGISYCIFEKECNISIKRLCYCSVIVIVIDV
jgi:hypothetical protein